MFFLSCSHFLFLSFSFSFSSFSFSLSPPRPFLAASFSTTLHNFLSLFSLSSSFSLPLTFSLSFVYLLLQYFFFLSLPAYFYTVCIYISSFSLQFSPLSLPPSHPPSLLLCLSYFIPSYRLFTLSLSPSLSLLLIFCLPISSSPIPRFFCF